MKQGQKETILQQEKMALLGAMICCFLWGSGYPCIKLAYRYLGIASGDTAGILLFMGVRFSLAGIIVLAYGCMSGHKLLLAHKKNWRNVFVLQFFQPVLIHVFFYIGLAHTKGVTSSVMSGLATLCTVLMSCYLFHLEKMTVPKITGCLLGFAGVIIYNMNQLSGRFSLWGEGMFLLFALVSGFGYNLIKIFVQDEDVITFSGWQYLLGGILTILVGLMMGGRITQCNGAALRIMSYLILASAISFTVWSDLIKVHDVSKVSVYRFMEPLFGVVVSILLLHEKVNLLQTMLALIFVCIGMYAVNAKTLFWWKGKATGK